MQIKDKGPFVKYVTLEGGGGSEFCIIAVQSSSDTSVTGGGGVWKTSIFA